MSQLQVLYMKRTANERDKWSGQVAFPGGMKYAFHKLLASFFPKCTYTRGPFFFSTPPPLPPETPKKRRKPPFQYGWSATPMPDWFILHHMVSISSWNAVSRLRLFIRKPTHTLPLVSAPTHTHMQTRPLDFEPPFPKTGKRATRAWLRQLCAKSTRRWACALVCTSTTRRPTGATVTTLSSSAALMTVRCACVRVCGVCACVHMRVRGCVCVCPRATHTARIPACETQVVRIQRARTQTERTKLGARTLSQVLACFCSILFPYAGVWGRARSGRLRAVGCGFSAGRAPHSADEARADGGGLGYALSLSLPPPPPPPHTHTQGKTEKIKIENTHTSARMHACTHACTHTHTHTHPRPIKFALNKVATRMLSLFSPLSLGRHFAHL